MILCFYTSIVFTFFIVVDFFKYHFLRLSYITVNITKPFKIILLIWVLSYFIKWNLLLEYGLTDFIKDVIFSISHKKNSLTLFFLEHLLVNRFWLKISVNANIEKTQIFHITKYDLKGHSRSHMMTLYASRIHTATFVLWSGCEAFLTFLFSDLMTTLTYVLMDNFWPCFVFRSTWRVLVWRFRYL